MESTLYKVWYKLKRRLFTGMFVVTLGFGSPALCKAKEELEKSETARKDGDMAQRKGEKETGEKYEIYTAI